MSLKKYIEDVKALVETFEGDAEAKALFTQVKEFAEKLLAGKPAEVAKKLSKWADVNETIELAGEGAKLREIIAKRNKALTLITHLVQLAVRFAPLVKSAKKKSSKG